MMSISEKVQIIHQAVVSKLPHKDIANEHRITAAYVSLLQKRALKKKRFIAELISQRDAKEEFRAKIKGAIEEMNKEEKCIDSVKSLKEILAERHDIVATSNTIRKVLHQDLNMSYRKIKAVNWTENSPKCKILRQ